MELCQNLLVQMSYVNTYMKSYYTLEISHSTWSKTREEVPMAQRLTLLDCDIVVNDIKLQSVYYVHF